MHLRNHIISRYAHLPGTTLGDLDRCVEFLSQFAYPTYGQVQPPSAAVAAELGHYYYTPAEAAQYKVGMVGRLNGSREYERFDGDHFKLGCFSAKRTTSASKSRPAQVERYQAITLEADAWLNGKDFTPDVVVEGRETSLRAIAVLRNLLDLIGSGDLINLVMSSGGKSIHAHLVTTGTTDEYTHKRLVGAVKQVASIAFASEGLDLDPAPLRPNQAVRIPCGMVLGRDQHIIEFDGVATKDHDAFLAAFDAPSDAYLAERARLAGIANERCAAALQNIPEGLKPGKVRGIEQRLTTLIAVTDAVLGKIVEVDAPRSKRGRARAQAVNDTARGPRVNLDLGRVIFAEPLDGRTPIGHGLLKHCASSDHGTGLIDSVATGLWRNAVQHNDLSRVSVTAPGEADSRRKSFIYHDSFRGHAVYSDPSGTEMTPVIPPIGNALIDAWSEFDMPLYDMLTYQPTADVNFVFAQAGTGKTTMARRIIGELLDTNPEARVVFTAPNVTLGQQVSKLFEADGRTVVYYKGTARLNGRVALTPGTVYVCTMHNLKYIDPKSVDLFVMDEIATALEMYNNTSTAGVWRGEDEARQTFEALKGMTLNSKRAVLLEAIVTPATLVFEDFIYEAAKAIGKSTDERRTRVKTGADKVVDVMKESLIYGEAERVAASGKRILFQIGHRGNAAAFAQRLELRLGKPVLLVSATTSGTDAVKAALTEGGMEKYGAVVATTALAAGVSFVDVFDTVFFVAGTHLTAQVMAQAIHRDRTAQRIVISRPVAREDAHRSISEGGHKERAAAALSDTSGFDAIRHAVVCDGYMTSVGFERLVAYLRHEGFTMREGVATLNWIIEDSAVAACKETRARKMVRASTRSQYEQAIHDYTAECKKVRAAVVAGAAATATTPSLAIMQSEAADGVQRMVKLFAKHGLVTDHLLDQYIEAALPTDLKGWAKYADRLHNAASSWRDATRILHGETVVQTAEMREWLACSQILDDALDMSAYQLVGKAAQVAQRDVDAETPGCREQYVLTTVKTERLRKVEVAAKRSTCLRADPEASRMASILGHLTQRVPAKSLVTYALRIVFGVTIKVRANKRLSLTTLSVDRGSAAIMATVAAAAMTYTPQYKAFAVHSFTTPHWTPAPRWAGARIAEVVKEVLAGASMRRHLVKEIDGLDMWQASAPRVVALSKVKARAAGEGPALYLNEVQTGVPSVSLMPLVIPDELPFLRFAVPSYDMAQGEVVNQRFTAKSACIARWTQVAATMKDHKRNRNSSYAQRQCPGTVWVGAPPPT